MKRYILIALLIILIAIQFIRPERNLGAISRPHDITHYVTVPDTVMHVLQRSCYDCHSNHTVYPWYANINPVGFWLNGHIKDGKRAINFSDLSSFDKRKLDHRLNDIADEVKSGDMPLSSYTLIHTYARLDSNEVRLLADWTESARKEGESNQ